MRRRSRADVLGLTDSENPLPFAIEHGKLATGDATPVGDGVLELELGHAPAWNGRAADAVAPPGSAYDHPAEGVVSHRVAATVGVLLPTASGRRLTLGVSQDLWVRHGTRTCGAMAAVKLPF